VHMGAAVGGVEPCGYATTERALSAEGTTPGNQLLLIELMYLSTCQHARPFCDISCSFMRSQLHDRPSRSLLLPFCTHETVRELVNAIFQSFTKPITVAAQSEACTEFYLSSGGWGVE
jgi:hypothetical protein